MIQHSQQQIDITKQWFSHGTELNDRPMERIPKILV